ncbi:MAG: FG-GAP-like repeat-containing protein, partial [Acidimicrobiales bacterium]
MSLGFPAPAMAQAEDPPIVALASPTGDDDGDGIENRYEDANLDLDDDAATNPGPDTDGDTVPDYLDPDDDGDGLPTASESADPNADGNPSDAVDSDLDAQPDYLDSPIGLASGAPVVSEQKVSATVGGFTGPLASQDYFGSSVQPIGDLDRDGVVDVAVGAYYDDGAGFNRGAVYILFLNADGTVKTEQQISQGVGGFVGPTPNDVGFGRDLAAPGDIDGDGIADLVVGSQYDTDGGSQRGAVWVLFMNTDGTVKAEQKISSTTGGLTGPIDDFDQFGNAVAAIGDLDGDGRSEIAVGAKGDDDGFLDAGAVYVLYLTSSGTVASQTKISDTTGGLVAPLANTDFFGDSVGPVGDVDGDGAYDVLVGATGDDTGGSDRGAAYVLMLNTNGTVKAESMIASGTGGLTYGLLDGDRFGYSIAGVGDADQDGNPDIMVGAPQADLGGNDRGLVLLLNLDASGSVIGEAAFGSGSNGVAGPLENFDYFGSNVASLGDLDGDGTLNVVISAVNDDDGSLDAGAFYVFDLTATGVVVVNSTGDASDLSAGNGVCDTGALNTQGDPQCTLRAAIEEANASAGIDTIHFDIPTSEAGYVGGSPAYWVIGQASNYPD